LSSKENTERGRDGVALGGTVAHVLALVAWVAVAFWLYDPLRPRPYEVADFPEFLPVIRESASPLDAVANLTRYYLPHGRLNLVAFSILSLKWYALGENMALWQIARLAEMAILSWLVFIFVRRLGATRVGAWAAIAIFLASPAAALSWIRMSIAEPPGTILLILLCLLLLGVPRALGARTRLAMLALTVVLIGLTKEALLVTVPVATLALVARDKSDHGVLRRLSRDARLWAVVAGGTLVALPLAMAASLSQGYSGLFGAVPVTPANFFFPLLAGLMPFAPATTPPSFVDLLAIALYFSGIILTWGFALRKGPEGPGIPAFALGIGLPIVGAAIYTLWPSYRLFYALPFQVGAAVLVSITVGRIFSASRFAQAGGAAALVIIAAPMLVFAHAYVSLTDASRELTRDTAIWLGGLPPTAHTHFEVCGLPPDHFAHYGIELRRYALSLDLKPPEVTDVPCGGEARPPSPQSQHWRVVLSDRTFPGSSEASSRVYTHTTLNLTRFQVQRDSIVVTTWPPA
jgi:hypothetical protein